MALKEIYHIKLGPLPSLWKHHDRPTITNYKIGCMDNVDVQGPPTLDNVTITCRKLVPVGSIAVDKSLVAGIEVCLQNKLPIIKA